MDPSPDDILPYVYGAAAIFGALIFLFFLNIYLRASEVKEKGVTAIGKVLSMKDDAIEARTYLNRYNASKFIIPVSFTTSEGEGVITVLKGKKVGARGVWHNGEEVQVIYNSKNPKKVVYKETKFMNTHVCFALMSIGGAICFSFIAMLMKS